MAVTLTATQIRDLDRMNEASRRAGGLGTILMGGAGLPNAGTLQPIATLKYSITPALASTTGIHAAITSTQASNSAIVAPLLARREK